MSRVESYARSFGRFAILNLKAGYQNRYAKKMYAAKKKGCVLLPYVASYLAPLRGRKKVSSEVSTYRKVSTGNLSGNLRKPGSDNTPRCVLNIPSSVLLPCSKDDVTFHFGTRFGTRNKIHVDSIHYTSMSYIINSYLLVKSQENQPIAVGFFMPVFCAGNYWGVTGRKLPRV